MGKRARFRVPLVTIGAHWCSVWLEEKKPLKRRKTDRHSDKTSKHLRMDSNLLTLSSFRGFSQKCFEQLWTSEWINSAHWLARARAPLRSSCTGGCGYGMVRIAPYRWLFP